MTNETKSAEMVAFLDSLTLNTFGRARSVAKAGHSCVSCGQRADTFRDALSQREFGISGLCQTCQDAVFGE